jgi:predicted DNA-binding transcriptional regulator YafY
VIDEPTVTLEALMDRFGLSRSTISRLIKRLQVPVVPDQDEPKRAAIRACDVRRVREARQKGLKHWGGRMYYLPPD